MNTNLTLYDQFSPEGKTLLNEAFQKLSAAYDPVSRLVSWQFDEEKHVSLRASLYYALALMIRDGEGAWDTIEDICRAVLALQMNAPEEIFHGVFRHNPDEKLPPVGTLDYRRLGLYGRYWADCTWERVTDSFHQKLAAHPVLCENAGEIEVLLRTALTDTVPVVWDTYEPNLREFLLMCFAMLLRHGERRMSAELKNDLLHSARLAMEGSITRSQTNFTPLNTNIQCMHIFLLDFFGALLNEPAWRDYAVSYAGGMLSRYREHHACAEFNSPTYCGVDLSTLGFVRRYSDNEKLISLAEELESGIWQDMADFYNPSMRNFCGPYSRAYEMDMAVHTCFCDMLYWALGEKDFPWHPFSVESVNNPLMLLGDIRMPEDVKRAFLTPKQDAAVCRTFRELSERGDPENNSALCTAEAWITPDLMAGVMRGSENPSYQLHPLVVFWRQKTGLGTIKLLRCLPDGQMTHLHTVFFNGTIEKNRLTMDVNAQVRRDVDIFFEIECDGMDTAVITENEWRLPGLTVTLNAKAPKAQVRRINARTLRVIYPARISQPDTMRMRFELTLNLLPEG
ncbi:MAG: hypothetical protein IKN04_00520 [Clostridia bacterium]|nr:hypothetical protein [Clostridia bacterium]